MGLIMSNNLKEAMKKNKELVLDKEESSEPRLIINIENNKTDGFRVPTNDDLGYDIPVDVSLEGVTKYVKEHTSNQKYDYEMGEGGVIIVPFKRFVEMINDGYNIYYSEVLNENAISIKYQKELKREGRGR